MTWLAPADWPGPTCGGQMLDRRTVIAGIASAPLIASPARAGLTTKHGFNDEQIDWLFYDDGLARAQEITRPVLLLAHATWCPYCQRTKRLYHDAKVVDLLQWYVPVLVDIDREPRLSARYAPDGNYVPRHLILMPDGTHVAEARGPYDKQKYLIPYLDAEWLRYFLAKSYGYVKARATKDGA